ncbi:MAG: hypothetical protein E7089_08635 [Bacteroidales bacterium]|nr:hypothetical protein [Bacteroidales bacterium]MBR2606466.1 hypothetical protein [Bacteroidaceae bacterium]
MSRNEKIHPFFERNNNKTARIVYRRTFGYITTDDREGEIRFCQEIFRSSHITHSQIKRTPPLQKF